MIPLLFDLNSIPPHLLGGAVAVGNFDGIHRGHAQLVQQLVNRARLLGGPAIVLTFDPPPIAILYPQRSVLPPITPLKRRAELLGQLGVDGLFVLTTNLALLNLTPEQFVQQVLVGQLHLRAIVEGPNFRFGKDRAGDIQLLGQLCLNHEVMLHVVDAASDSVGMISSTRIRSLLAQGDVAAANSMLTQSFRLSGVVGQGAGRGKSLLVPTANLTEVQSLIPAHGVYSGRVEIDGRSYRAAVNIGPNPTFGEQHGKIEVHLLQWQGGELYGQPLQCDLLERIRDVRKFDSRDELLQQIQLDIARVAQTVSLPG